MGMERELKFLDADLESLRRILIRAGAEGSGVYFERNLVFDTTDRTLKRAGTLLRLREKRGKAILTVKQPPEGDESSLLKVFRERELEVPDFESMRSILESVGFNVAFAYEKFREKWGFMGCTVCLDQLPFGRFVEIEGDEQSVPACAEALGLDMARTTKQTYHGLNLAWRAASGLEEDENFTFDPDVMHGLFEKMGKQ